MKKILLAVDGSESSDKAVTKVSELAASIEASITLITIIEDLDVSYEESNSSKQSSPSPRKIKKIQKQKDLESEGENILNKAESTLQENDLKTEKVILKGNPADKICEYDKENDFDLIALGNRGKGGIKKFLLGSTSERVLRHAENSVLIVK